MKKIRQRGMSLLEVVVAMLVVGIALAGSLAMIQAANRFGLSAENMSIAQQHAQSLIDRIRANQFEIAQVEDSKKTYVMNGLNLSSNELKSLQDRTVTGANARDGLYNRTVTVANAYKTTISCANGWDKCTTKEIAKNDISFQLKQIAQELPQGIAVVAKYDGKPGKYVVMVMWKSASETQSLNPTSSSVAEDKLNSYGIAIPFSI